MAVRSAQQWYGTICETISIMFIMYYCVYLCIIKQTDGIQYMLQNISDFRVIVLAFLCSF